MTSLGLLLCRCGHEQRDHREGRDCRAPVPPRPYAGSRRCPCCRFIEAPWYAQQLPLFRPIEVSGRL